MQGKRWWRMAEPCLLMALFVTLGMLLPLAFPCTPTQCYIEQGQTQPVCPPGISPNVQCVPGAAAHPVGLDLSPADAITLQMHLNLGSCR